MTPTDFFAFIGVLTCVVAVVAAGIYAGRFVLKIKDKWDELDKHVGETNRRIANLSSWIDKMQSEIDHLEPPTNDRPNQASQPGAGNHPEHWSSSPQV